MDKKEHFKTNAMEDALGSTELWSRQSDLALHEGQAVTSCSPINTRGRAGAAIK